MAKQKKTQESSEVLAPISVTVTDDAKAQDISLQVPEGHVYIVALNEDGTEKEDSGFFYPEKSYRRFYGDEAKFQVKKKAK